MKKLKNINMLILVVVIFISFFINHMYLEASSLTMYNLSLSIIDERIPFNLPPVFLSDDTLFSIIKLCDSELELKLQLWHILYTISLQYDISVQLEAEAVLEEKRIFRFRIVISIILLIIISYVFYYYVFIPLRSKYSKRKKK